jgi:hypothetical protein
MAAAAPPEPLFTHIYRYYRPGITTSGAAQAHLAANPGLRGFVRPSSELNKLTVTYRTPGGIAHTRLRFRILDDSDGSDVSELLPGLLQGFEQPVGAVAAPAEVDEDPVAFASERRGRRGRRATRKYRR